MRTFVRAAWGATALSEMKGLADMRVDSVHELTTLIADPTIVANDTTVEGVGNGAGEVVEAGMSDDHVRMVCGCGDLA